MLTAATKRKIDTARDILVGKIPVPTSQVEQITLALVYKFMSDMDKRAKDLGDSSGFFANGYGKYAWDNLMDKALPARDRVLLYREALEKMSLNPHIPQLFRDVFRDASLPFNDPETLKLFLDVIDQFEYDHSEELGNAFEYLLQVMGSQGDAGQFRTPRHIIDFIVDVVEPSKTDKILDPACGTAGFLISAYNHIKNKGLSADEMTQLSENFVGYDISQDMQRLSLVNLYLHHFPNPHIYEYDTLTSEDRWNDDFDVILANPPFMTPKGGIRPHNRFSVPSKRAEVLFVDYIMEHLTVRGKAGVIVPEGIIFQSQNAYKQLRKMMVESNYLWAVVSLPSGVFNPYSGVKTSILLFDREIAKKTDKILFVKINNDGFDLGAQRKSVEGSQIEEATRILRKYKQNPTIAQDKLEEYAEDVASKIELRGKDLKNYETVAFEPITPQLVKKSEIEKSGDYNLSGERYISKIEKKSNYDLVPLSEMAEIFTGKLNANASVPNGKYPFYTCGDETLLIDTPAFDGESILLAGNGNFGIKYHSNGKFNAYQRTYVIRSNKEKLSNKYLYYVLHPLVENLTSQGGVIQYLRLPQLQELQIPLPPLSVQQEIVVELDRYQKIIDGAKQVVENYKPDFEIETGWNWKKISEITNERIQSGIAITKDKYDKKGKYGFINLADLYNVSPLSKDDLSKVDVASLDRKFVKNGDILFVRVSIKFEGAGYANAYYGNEKSVVYGDNVLRLTPNRDMVDSKFLFYLFRTDHMRKKLLAIANRANVTSINVANLSNLEIPIPPKPLQKEIVSILDNEANQILTLKDIQEKFAMKITKRIESIWNG